MCECIYVWDLTSYNFSVDEECFISILCLLRQSAAAKYRAKDTRHDILHNYNLLTTGLKVWFPCSSLSGLNNKQGSNKYHS